MTEQAAMDVPLIELNDTELRVARGSEIVVRSPAYIVAGDHAVLIGEQARQQAHLRPQKMHNRFWSNLNQNDLQTITRRYRHNADLAFAQLVDIHKQAGKPAEMVFSVPGSFSDEQLSLLLGIVEACPFRAVGLVDSAVAAASAVAGRGSYQHLDIELHRAVLTNIGVDEEVVREGVEIIDQTGLSDIYDTAAELVTDTMIRQCRFDPQRQAESEQALYDQLPLCFDGLTSERETVFEIQFQGVKHQVRIERDAMLERLARHYEAILKGLNPGRSCLVTDRLARLPGFTAQLQAPTLLDELCVFRGMLEHLEEVYTAGPALNYVTRLTPASGHQVSGSRTSRPEATKSEVSEPVDSSSPSSGLPPPIAEKAAPPPASHLLHKYSAYALSDSSLYLSEHEPVSLTHCDSAACSVAMVDQMPVVRRENDRPVFVNGKQLDTSQKLAPGDKIETGSNNSTFTLITVVPDHGPEQ